MIRWLAVAGMALLQLAKAQELPSVSGLPHAVVLRRIPATEGWDLVVALSSDSPRVWTTKDRLGLLLQNGDQVLPLAIEPGPNDDCSTRVERFTLEELVLSCVGEKWTTYDNQKFVYDMAARTVTSHFSYAPFGAERVLPGPKFTMASGDRRLMVDIDAATGNPGVTGEQARDGSPETEVSFGPGGRFHLSTLGDRFDPSSTAVIERQAGRETVYRLPQTDLKTWELARPDATKGYSSLSLVEFDEEIGPHQVEGGRLWFGKKFYDAEGATGLGGFGYFDPATGSYRLSTPPEIYAWSVSAMLVEPDCVWLALDRLGEYGNYPGGLLRWDRGTEAVQHWELPSVVANIARGGNAIYMGTTDGIAALRGDRVVSYFVDRSAAGQYRMAERN